MSRLEPEKQQEFPIERKARGKTSSSSLLKYIIVVYVSLY